MNNVFSIRLSGAFKSLALFTLCLCALPTFADINQAIARLAKDSSQGKPLVAHITVALCDNDSQGIVPVGNGLCDGDAPQRNLYWGALYGVKTYFSKHKDWKQIKVPKPADKRILDRVVFHRTLNSENKDTSVPIYVVADAWRGKEIRSATTDYLEKISGNQKNSNLPKNLQTNGNAHILAYVGHNGLMDFSLPDTKVDSDFQSTSSAIILACKSDSYFAKYLSETNTNKLLTTSGFMAPEAYTLEAAITRWFSGGTMEETHLAASTAYSQYQKAKLSWTKRLFLFDQ